jgi:hypothetical protein
VPTFKNPEFDPQTDKPASTQTLKDIERMEAEGGITPLPPTRVREQPRRLSGRSLLKAVIQLPTRVLHRSQHPSSPLGSVDESEEIHPRRVQAAWLFVLLIAAIPAALLLFALIAGLSNKGMR